MDAFDRHRLIQWLVAPSAAIVNSEPRRQATLLSAALLSLLVIGVVIYAASTLLLPSDIIPLAGWAGLVGLGVIYGLSRTRYFRLAAWLTIITIQATIIATMVSSQSDVRLAVLPTFLLIPVIFASMLISLRGTILIGIANLPLMVLAHLYIDSHALNQPDVLYPVMVLSICSLLIMLFMRYRDIVEQDHEAELSRLYQQSQGLNEVLETKVNERTAELQTRIAENQGLLERITSSEKLLRQVIDSARDWIWAKDLKSNFVLVNRRLAVDYGHLSDDLIGHDERILKRLPEGMVSLDQAEDQEVLKTGKSLHKPNDVYVRPDGSARLFDTMKMPLFDGDGVVIGTLGRSRDITEAEEHRRRQRGAYELGNRLNQLLREPEALLYTTVTYLNHAFHYYHAHIYLLEDDHKTLTVGEGTGKVGKTLKEMRHSLSIDSDRGLVPLAARTLEPVIVNDVTTNPDYLPNPFLPDTRAEIALPIVAGDALLGVLDAQHNIAGHFNDDEERTLRIIANQLAVALSNARLLAEVERSEELVRTVINGSPDWIWAKDRAFRYILVNQAMASQGIGSSPEEIIGKTDDDFFPMDLIEGDPETGTAGFRADDEQALRGETIHNHSTTLRQFDGAIHIRETHKYPLRDKSGTIVGTLGISRDITEQQRAEAALATARDGALEASRLKSQFLANMSHELRTPLNSIIGFGQILVDGLVGDLNTQQGEFTNDILSSAQHLLRLINDVLDMSKIEAGQMLIHPEPFEFKALCQETADVVRSLVEAKHQTLHLDIADDLPALNADKFRIKQVLLNLLSNANKFTPADGTITLHVEHIEYDSLLISIADSGAGIAEDDLDLIFQEFRQVDSTTTREAGGTGLGLPITRRLIEMHGGTIWVDSTPGEGSVFSILLPIDGPSDKHTRIFPSYKHGQSQTVEYPLAFIAESDRSFANILALHFSQAGYNVMQFYDGLDLVEQASLLKPDLISLDVPLPQKNGLQLLRELRTAPETARIPVLMIASAEHQKMALDMGVKEFLVKPPKVEVLREALTAIHQPVEMETKRVIVVDDEGEIGYMLNMLLGSSEFEITMIYNPLAALEAVTASPPDVLVLDLLMPTMDGFEFIKRVREEAHLQTLPIIVFSSHVLSSAETRFISTNAQAVVAKGGLTNIRSLLAEMRRVTNNPSQIPEG